MADLTVVINDGHLKTGSRYRSERIEYINQLTLIIQQPCKLSEFAGKQDFEIV
ncbi:MAG: hypothetical protein IH591_17510 [Bacteroidales bacterium]|nr:hypothetical protein [Bacteroidales bacterium]